MEHKHVEGYIHVADNFYIKPCASDGSIFDLFQMSSRKTGKRVGEDCESIIGYGLTLERVVVRVGREVTGLKIIKGCDNEFGDMLEMLDEISTNICINIKNKLK